MIPVDVAEITPEWMSGALERDVRTVTVLDQHSGTTGRALVGLEYGNASDAGPDTAFVILDPASAGGLFAGINGLGLSTTSADIIYVRNLA